MSEKVPKNNDKYTANLAAMAAVQPSAALTAAMAAVQPSAALTAAMAAVQPSAALTAAMAAVQPSAALTAAMATVQPSAALTAAMATVQPSAALGIQTTLAKDAVAISNLVARHKEIEHALHPNLSLQKILDRQNALGKLIDNSGVVNPNIAGIEAMKIEIARQVASPLVDFHKQSGAIGRIAREHSAVFNALENSTGIIAEKHSHLALFQDTMASFRLPRADELYKVHVEHERWSKISNLGASLTHLENSMSAISTPWIRLASPSISIAGFAALQGVGAAVHHIQAFDPGGLEVLRQNLGDWRSLPKWPRRLLTDPLLRTEFYIAHGFNASLTDFPEPVFDVGLNSAGLGNDDLGVLEFQPVYQDPDETEALATKRRATACFEILYIFEEKLRAFIDRKMTEKFGANWMSSRLPAGMKESWMEKQASGVSPQGLIGTLIDFADFTDYEKIICKKDNWREVFATFFVHAELIKMAFYFLRPIRITIMHSRKPTYNDELFLRAEVTKLSVFF